MSITKSGHSDPHPGSSSVEVVAHWLHAHFLRLLIASYVVAAIAPRAGLTIRSAHIGSSYLPSLLLAVLLSNAGAGFRLSALGQWRTLFQPLLIGTAGNVLLPVALLVIASRLLGLWHNTDEVQNIIVGLALVCSMPIAGSSTAWTQNAAGNVGLSLCLVLTSTIISHAATPGLLHFAGHLTTGVYSEDLNELAHTGTSNFLLLYVLIPSLLGIATNAFVRKTRTASAGPALRIVNSLVLLTLCYANAAVSLPKAVAAPDWDFLCLVLLITVAFCLCLVLSGLSLSRLLHLPRAQQISLTFGLGMSNNGTGLIIAASALADHPLIMLPMLFYNLTQHLIAGYIDRKFFSEQPHKTTQLRTT
jgi:BASS family bile acid:Na+ symporter